MNEANRNHKSNTTGSKNCDNQDVDWADPGDWKGDGWYRMMEPAGTKLPEQSPPNYHCGTYATGWLDGSHPSQPGESVSRQVCLNRFTNPCLEKWDVTVTNCNGYFVYYLPKVRDCPLRYCAE